MNRCSLFSAAFQSHACSASSACIRRGVAWPASSASCQHERRCPPAASSAPMSANAASRDLAWQNNRREQRAQRAVKLPQPGTVFCHGRDGHLSILLCHSSRFILLRAHSRHP
jgi:hypothetical protein